VSIFKFNESTSRGLTRWICTECNRKSTWY